jgi:hypothetical protein
MAGAPDGALVNESSARSGNFERRSTGRGQRVHVTGTSHNTSVGVNVNVSNLALTGIPTSCNPGQQVTVK